MALSNLHTLMMKRRGIRMADATGDGTGFALSITQHYATTATKEKDAAKENPPPSPVGTGDGKSASSGKKAKRFVYSFRLLDLVTRMYVAYGTSLRSERAAFEQALAWLQEQGIEVHTVRLDRYYSHASDAARFPGAAFYFLPRKNVRVHLQHEFLAGLRRFVEHPMEHMEGYYQRENSEAGFSADKRMFGWGIPQRRGDRIETADRCHSTWHNLFNLYGPDRSLPVGAGPR